MYKRISLDWTVKTNEEQCSDLDWLSFGGERERGAAISDQTDF